jgi:hypothetical protein
MAKSIYPTRYELVEVLSSTNRGFLNAFAQERGIFITNTNIESLAKEIANLFLDEDDLELIRAEAYNTSSNHALSGFVVKSENDDFSLKNTYQWIYENAERGPDIKLSSPVRLSGKNEIFKGSVEYNRKKAGRIEFLQDEKSSFDFYMQDLGKGQWQVEVDSNRSTDISELKKLMDLGLNKETEMVELEQKLLTTENSIQFFDILSKRGMDSQWRFVDIKHLTLRKGSEILDPLAEKDPDKIEEVKEEELLGITSAILQGQNLRENSFVKQSVKNGYNFNAMTYEFVDVRKPYYIQIKAEFKGRPKVFEVSIVSYAESVDMAAERHQRDLSESENRSIRSGFWNNSKIVFNELTKRR